MAGAIAGAAILNANKQTNSLHTITVTINNKCNLKCPHCYLQYNSNKTIIEKSTIENIFQANFKHLAIVGQEPFLNKDSISVLELLIKNAKKHSKTVSVITNGLNLSRLKADYFSLIDYLDVSFDGGPETYQNYRMAKFDKVISGIDYALSSGLKKINALHTLNTLNIKDIDDMVRVQNYFAFDKILYSPYLVTKNDGSNSVSALELFKIINKLASSDTFVKSKSSFLMVDLFHLWQQGLSAQDFKEKLSLFPNLISKVLLFEIDPLFHGIIRVSYDDFILTPQESLHPKKYKESKLTTSENNLNDAYSMLINNYDQSRNKELELSI